MNYKRHLVAFQPCCSLWYVLLASENEVLPTGLCSLTGIREPGSVATSPCQPHQRGQSPLGFSKCQSLPPPSYELFFICCPAILFTHCRIQMVRVSLCTFRSMFITDTGLQFTDHIKSLSGLVSGSCWPQKVFCSLQLPRAVCVETESFFPQMFGGIYLSRHLD